MKEENKQCWSCGRFERYYTKGYCNLQKENVGFCSYQNKIVCVNETCMMWKYRQRVRYMRKQMAITSLCEIYDKITVIEEILKEENELDKIKNETDTI